MPSAIRGESIGECVAPAPGDPGHGGVEAPGVVDPVAHPGADGEARGLPRP